MVEGPFIEVFVSANNHDSRDIILSKLIKKVHNNKCPSGSGYFGLPVAGYYPISEFSPESDDGFSQAESSHCGVAPTRSFCGKDGVVGRSGCVGATPQWDLRNKV